MSCTIKMEDFKNTIYTLPLSERAYIQWFHEHGVTSWSFSFVVKWLLGGSFEVVFLKVQPKNQLHQSLPVCVRHSVCRIPPNPPHQNIWELGPWIRMLNKLDRWFCCTLHSENHWSKASCLGQTDFCWRMRNRMGEQLWVGS